MTTYLILSIDRRNTPAEAMQVVELALKYRERGVVGIDLCGNPLKGDVTLFREAFDVARRSGLKLTLHFAEVPESSTETELHALLSYSPDRIGHVIHVSPAIAAEIEKRRLGLELCLSCNVHAKMIAGGFPNHHFGEWYSKACPIALCVSKRISIAHCCHISILRRLTRTLMRLRRTTSESLAARSPTSTCWRQRISTWVGEI